MTYKLNRIEDTDIFFLAQKNIDLLGELIIQGSFSEVLEVANQLKSKANDIGVGDLVSINNPAIELSNISKSNWYLLILEDRYQIVRTSEEIIYNLPTNIKAGSGKGSLENIFNKIIELETAQ